MQYCRSTQCTSCITLHPVSKILNYFYTSQGATEFLNQTYAL